MNVYEIVTEQVIKRLEAGVIPWRKAWASGEQFPINLVSKKRYRGLNVWMLSCAGFAAPYWLSYKQAQGLGGQVKRGEKSSTAIFWKLLDGKDKTTGEAKRVPLLRYYSVFNVEQCDGIDYPKPEARLVFNPIESAEKIVEAMPLRPVIQHIEARAYYNRAADVVNMPKRDTFTNEQEYYSTLFHELTHATGHETRLARSAGDAFGSSYAREELLAEMGAAYLAAEAGIAHCTLDNSAAYISNWLGKLKDDAKLVVVAAAAAQKASDYILGRTYAETVAPAPA